MFLDKNGDINLVKIFAVIVPIIFLIIVLFSSFTIIHAGERGVVLSGGAFRGNIFDPGIHVKIPFYQSIIKMDIRTVKLEITGSEAYSHDLQNVKIHSVVNYNIDPKSVGSVYQSIGVDFENKILAPNLEASVKQTIAKYTAEEILSKRSEVQSEIENSFRQSIPSSFTITKYALVDEAFTPAYEAAIEAKQVAQQNAEKAQNELKRAQIDAESRVAQAKGEAEAIKIQAEAITQQGGKDYVSLKMIEKWNGSVPETIIPGQSVPFFNLGK